MAQDKTNNLKAYLTDLYEGIVSKKPDASRNPQDFRSEIESIETGGGDALAEAMRVRDGYYLFVNSPMTEAPWIDTSNYTTLSWAFYGCSKLLSVPLYNTSNVTMMAYMFQECKALQTVPLFDTSNVTTMSRMFNECRKLTTVPLFDTSKVTDMYAMFYNCSSLRTIPSLDLRNTSMISSIFEKCANITELWIRNIKVSLTVGTTSYGTKLSVDSLIHLVCELRKQSSACTLAMGSTNLAKLADVYVKAIDITDEMRAEDDLIDEKYPFVRCESTDDGAMLITDYATTVKNWTIK